MTKGISMDKISAIQRHIESGERLTNEMALFLFREADIISLGEMANRIREKLHGNKTYFIKNRHVDYSNVCAIKCKFCAFARKEGQEGAFSFSINQIVSKMTDSLHRGITELHIVGGFHPTHPWEFYTGMLKALKAAAPQVHLKCFTAAEIRYFSKKFRMSQQQVLEGLMEAGLDSMPGGGAEILVDRVRKEICGPKGLGAYWLETHQLAHQLGLKTNATMLYGHIETIEDRVEHMSLIRDLQDQSGGFLSFIPLSFNPKDTEYESRGYTSGQDDIKTLAISRLYFDNISHIKAYWIMSGVDMAQLGQHFGADDVHGTVIEENITHMAGAVAPEDLSEKNLLDMITSSGRLPVQRDSLYRVIKEYA